MIDIQVFIASCGSKVALSHLNDIEQGLKTISEKEITFDLVVRPWNTGLSLGRATLNGLIERARESDFAIVVFTGDDLVKRGGSLFDWAWKPRDNVVFEAGLFIGGLSLDPDRTLLLSAVRSAVLFSDLKGITFITLSEHEPEREAFLKTALTKIRERVVDAGPIIRPAKKRLKKQDVFDRERLVPATPNPNISTDEYLEADSSVVVCSSDPLEAVDADFANVVFANISSRIRYEYFFPAENVPAHRFVSLVFRLLTHHVTALTPEEIKRELETDSVKLAKAEENLVKLTPYLTVHLMPEPPAFRFCVHNAESDSRARCYLRQEKDEFDFVALKSGNEARNVATQLLKTRSSLTTSKIFSFIKSFPDTQKQSFRSQIEAEVATQFPVALLDKVKRACFS